MLDAARAAFGQSDVQLQGRDQKVSALSFHVTLPQMRPARCRWQNIGISLVVKRLPFWRVFADFAKTLALPWFNLPKRDRFILAGFIWANVVGAMGTALYAPSWCKVAWPLCTNQNVAVSVFWQLVYLLANSQIRTITRITATMQTIAPVNLTRESRVRSRTSFSAASS